MPSSIGLLPRLWRTFRPASRPPTPYAVACPGCGFLLQGQRRSRHQVLPCPHCKHPVFILPRSPFSTPTAAAGQRRPPARQRFFWVMPTLAGLATLLVLAGLFFALLPSLSRHDSTPEDSATTLREQIGAGRQALAAGGFHQAAEKLARSWDQAREQPDLLSPVEQRELYQAYRQADLFEHLLSDSLQDLLQKAQAAGGDEEWKARFRKDYQGKAVIFDDRLQLDGTGRPALSGTSVRSGELSARIALEDLRLVSWLPLDRRVIFGAKLAGFALEGGRWVIRFEPDSGVLLTDLGVPFQRLRLFRGLPPTLLDSDKDGKDVEKVLNQQKDLLEQAPR